MLYLVWEGTMMKQISNRTNRPNDQPTNHKAKDKSNTDMITCKQQKRHTEKKQGKKADSATHPTQQSRRTNQTTNKQFVVFLLFVS
jgi:hypothetical protein